MKIVVNKEPFIDNIFNDGNWEVNAEFKTNVDSTADSCGNAFVSAMILEGYYEYSIAKSMVGWMLEKDMDIEGIINEAQ